MRDREQILDALNAAEDGNGIQPEMATVVKDYILDMEDVILRILEASHHAENVTDSWDPSMNGDEIDFESDEDYH